MRSRERRVQRGIRRSLMSHDVFISYSSKDKLIADSVCATLEGRRIRCFIAPRDILPGVPYAEALIDGIDGSRLVVLVFSESANVSTQVAREIERACSKGLVIIPFRIEDAPMSKEMEYYLSSPHWLDALTPPLQQHLEHLAETVGLLLDRGTGSRPVRPGGDLPAAPIDEAQPTLVHPGHPPAASQGEPGIQPSRHYAAVAMGGVRAWLKHRGQDGTRRATVVIAGAIACAILSLVILEVARLAIQSQSASSARETASATQVQKRQIQEAVALALRTTQLQQGELPGALGANAPAIESDSPASVVVLDSTRSMAQQPVAAALEAYLSQNPPDGRTGLLSFNSAGALVLPLGRYSVAQLMTQASSIAFNGTSTNTIGGIRYALEAAALLGDSTRIILMTDGLNNPGPGVEERPLTQSEASRIDVLVLGDTRSPLPDSTVTFRSLSAFVPPEELVQIY